jgi:hypothetical protein
LNLSFTINNRKVKIAIILAQRSSVGKKQEAIGKKQLARCKKQLARCKKQLARSNEQMAEWMIFLLILIHSIKE